MGVRFVDFFLHITP